MRALEELEVEGIPTTRELALDVLRSDGFAAGAYSTGYLDEMEAPAARRCAAHEPRRDANRSAGGRRGGRRSSSSTSGISPEQPLATLFEGEPDAFATRLASAVAAEAPALDARITAASDEWPADRLGTLERNILRIGVHELEEGEVPAEVAINEAVVLAKRYATEDAARLVNGILGARAAGGRVSAIEGSARTRRCSEPRSSSSACGYASTRSRRTPSRAATSTSPSTGSAEIAELAKEIEAEVQRARQAADAGA